MLRPLMICGIAAAALMAFAVAPSKKSVFGYGGLAPHDGQLDGGPAAIRIDAQDGRLAGQILFAGEFHEEDPSEHGGHLIGGPSAYPELHIGATLIESVSVKGRAATVVGIGRIVSGAGEWMNEEVRITVHIEDGKGKRGADHIEVTCHKLTGELVFEKHGVMHMGDIKIGGGK